MLAAVGTRNVVCEIFEIGYDVAHIGFILIPFSRAGVKFTPKTWAPDFWKIVNWRAIDDMEDGKVHGQFGEASFGKSVGAGEVDFGYGALLKECGAECGGCAAFAAHDTGSTLRGMDPEFGRYHGWKL